MDRCYCGCAQWMGPPEAQSCAECGREKEPRNKRFLFVSNSFPHKIHRSLADQRGIDLIPVTGINPPEYTIDRWRWISERLEQLDNQHNADGVITSDPAVALVAANLSFPVGIYRQGSRTLHLEIWR